MRTVSVHLVFAWLVLFMWFAGLDSALAQATEARATGEGTTLTGVVQYQDLRRAGASESDQALVQVRDEEGTSIAETVTNDAGEFSVLVPKDGTFSVSAAQGALRSEYVIVRGDAPPRAPIRLTLARVEEIALEVISTLPPIPYRESSETYSVNRKDIETLPRGNNVDFEDVLATVPGATYGALKQIHIRQDHANLQLRIDGVPIPETVTSTFTDVISPRAWERADIILGGMEAQYGNRTAAVVDITGKSGTKPGFGSVQMLYESR